MNDNEGASGQYHYGAEDFKDLYRQIASLNTRLSVLESAIQLTTKFKETGPVMAYTVDEKADAFDLFAVTEIEQIFKAGQVSGENKANGRPFQTPTGYLKSYTR